jgi:replicative superfamily II helicase
LLFYPSQARTLVEQPLITRGQNVFVTLPTSTGKSLLGELALVASLSWDPMSRWLSVYLAPYRALTDQLQMRMRERLEKAGIRCLIRRGGYLRDKSELESGRPTVLVATPESFDSLLRQRPDLYRRLAACVFDEFHLIEQLERGLRYEGLLSRLMSGACGDGWPKIIGLSAAIQKLDRVEHSLNIEERDVARSPWRSSRRRLGIVDPQGRVEYFNPSNVRRETPPPVAWSSRIDIPHRNLSLPTKNYKSLNDQYSADFLENVAFVATDQWNRLTEPILVVAGSRSYTRRIAQRVAEQLPDLAGGRAFDLATQVRRRFPHLYTLQQCLLHGVAYHNASLPDWVRSQLERAIEDREIRIVASTTTLAEGIDLPFRVVVLGDWRLRLFGRSRPMPPLLFQNIAGRCGRAWIFVEGDTIICDSPNRDLKTFSERRHEYIGRYINPPPLELRSSIEWLLQFKDDQSSRVTKAVAESQFTAYVAVGSELDNTEEKFAKSLYASGDAESAAFIQNTVDEFSRDMLELTEFGQVVLRTGLSPRSGVAIAKFFNGLILPSEPRPGSAMRRENGIVWEPLIAALWKYILDKRDMQEINPYDTQIFQTKRGFPVTSENFLLLSMGWLSGLSIEHIAWLAFRGTTTTKNRIKSWLSGEDSGQPPADFEEDIEQIAVFCRQYLAEQWAWTFRGSAEIARHLSLPEIESQLSHVGTRLEYGVRNSMAIELLRSHCPMDRAKLDWLLSSFYLGQLLRMEVTDWRYFIDYLKENEPRLTGENVGHSRIAKLNIPSEEIQELVGFIQSRLTGDSTGTRKGIADE